MRRSVQAILAIFTLYVVHGIPVSTMIHAATIAEVAEKVK